jgi:hypothetical protein
MHAAAEIGMQGLSSPHDAQVKARRISDAVFSSCETSFQFSRNFNGICESNDHSFTYMLVANEVGASRGFLLLVVVLRNRATVDVTQRGDF